MGLLKCSTDMNRPAVMGKRFASRAGFSVHGLKRNMLAVIVASASFLVPSIIPKPMSMEATGGAYVLPHSIVIDAPPAADDAVDALVRLIKPSGTPIKRAGKGANVRLVLGPSKLDLGSDGYHLDVTSDGVLISAITPAGLFYGVQTLRQMLPAQLETGEKFELAGERLTCVRIVDQPRFSWRGMHLDESRHFFGVKAVKKYIDLLALHKMNVFHWHLVDDGGWRIEIKKYPKLTEVGAWRRGTGKGWDYINIDFAPKDGKEQLYGGFYTQDEIRDMVDYAKHRFITIVPEIEMPGHALPAPYNYHEVGCDDVAITDWQKATGMRYGNVYCAGKESTFEFVQNVLAEVCDLFPSEFIHIGGDEVDKRLWNHCPSCQKRMQDEGLKSPEELQSYFIKRVEKFLNSKGKRLMGWDEILEGGLAPNATVMSWRGIEGGIQAAKEGHDVVMSPTSHCYFDYPYTSISTELIYSYDPVPTALQGEETRHVLGAQGNVWTEWMENFDRVEQMAFPRAAALAEVVWSPMEGRRWEEFQGRLGDEYERLAALDVHFNLPVPIAKLDAILFKDKATVEFEAPAFEGGDVRYTTNGSDPSPRSAKYTGPIVMDHNGEVRAALFMGKVGSAPVRVSCVKAETPGRAELISGMFATVAIGKFAKVADLDGVSGAKSFAVKSFDLGVAGTDEGFGITFTGFIRIAKEGVYAFSTSSDDGSVLKIGGATVVDNDGLHGAVEKTGRVYLPQGVYPFTLQFFEAGGAQSLSISVTPPGGTKGPIPQDWLWRAGAR